MLIIPNISKLKKSQSLKVEGIGNNNNNNILNSVETNNGTLNKIRTSLKLPTIPNKQENGFHSETFTNSLIITKSLDLKSQFSLNKHKSLNGSIQNPLMKMPPINSNIKPKILLKVSENSKKKVTTSNKINGEQSIKSDAKSKPIEETVNNIKIADDEISDPDNNINPNINEENNKTQQNENIKNFKDIESLSKSFGEYKYIATSTSTLRQQPTTYNFNSGELGLAIPDQKEVSSQQNEQLDNAGIKPARISPLKFNTSGVGTLPPIKLSLHVNNEYNYKSFERINRNF